MVLGVGRRSKKRGEKWTKEKAWLQSGSATSQKQSLSETVATESKQSCPLLVLKALTKGRTKDRGIFTTGVKGAEFLELWMKPGGTFPLWDMRHSRKYLFQLCVFLVCALKHLLCFSTHRAW